MKHNFLVGLRKGASVAPSYAILYASGGLAFGGAWLAVLLAASVMYIICTLVYGFINVIFPDK